MKSTIGRFYEKKRFEHELRDIRRRQLADVKEAMKRVYNPLYFNSKPKYRKAMSAEEMVSFRRALKAVYNPPLKRRDWKEELGIKRMAET